MSKSKAFDAECPVGRALKQPSNARERSRYRMLVAELQELEEKRKKA